jgi:hypothetical protein
VPENIAALLSGQIDVENNQSGARHCTIGIRFIEEQDCLLSVSDEVEFCIETGGLDRTADEERVRRVIFDD